MKNAIFIISLDFELHWGGFEKWPLENYKTYFLNTRQVIPKLLALFEGRAIHATWATVGMLFHGTKSSLQQYIPNVKPSYANTELSAYQFIASQGIGDSEQNDPFHYAASLVQLIAKTPLQELGSHTFAHYYCNEQGQTVEQFREDLRASQQTAQLYQRKLNSLVFPRNQFNEEYLRVCYEEGFTAVRDNPRDWFWSIQSTQNESFWKRLNRGADAYFPIGNDNTYMLSSLTPRRGLPVCIPASRLLRPYRPKEIFLNDLKVNRIKSEMTRAAKKGEVYHLWWHPHNFGHYPEESMKGLEKILNHYVFCKDRYQMKSLSMGEVADLVIKERF